MNRNKILVVVDMQQDLVTGSLSGENQKAIVPNVVELIKDAIKDDCFIITTLDTHTLEKYSVSREGKYLNTKHCLVGTQGHKLIPEVSELLKDYVNCLEVPKIDSFGISCMERVRTNIMDKGFVYLSNIDNLEIHICGLVTNTCVLSTAVSFQNYFTRSEIYIHQNACASFDVSLHEKALDVMKGLQMNII